MVNILLNWWQLLAVIFIITIGIIIGKNIAEILIKIIFSSKPVMSWNMKRQLEQKKLQKKTQYESTKEQLENLGKFLDALVKMLPSNADKKQFFKDFALSKETRQYWMNYMLSRVTPSPEVIVKDKMTPQTKELIKQVKESTSEDIKKVQTENTTSNIVKQNSEAPKNESNG